MDQNVDMNISCNESSIVSRGATLFFVEACIFLTLDTMALAGNLLVCLAIYRNSSLRTVTNIFILSLALTDLVVSVAVMPFNTIASFADGWMFGYLGCQLVGVFAYGWAGISLLTLTLVAVNRYIRVVRSPIYTKIYSKKRAVIMVLVSWLVTAIVVGFIFPLAGIEFRTTRENPAIVSPSFSSDNSFKLFHYIHIVYIFIPSVVIATCYVKVFNTIRKHNKTVSTSFNKAVTPTFNKDVTPAFNKAVTPTFNKVVTQFFNKAVTPSFHSSNTCHGVEEARMTKLLAVVLVGFYLCWLPAFLTITLRLFNAIEKRHEVYSNFYYLFPAYTSSVINPVIYATMSKQFRAEFTSILRLK